MGNIVQSHIAARRAAFLFAMLIAVGRPPAVGSDDLRGLRDDVRSQRSHEDDQPAKRKRRKHDARDAQRTDTAWLGDEGFDSGDNGGDLLGSAIVVAGILTAPFWAPPVAMDDEYDLDASFPAAPYEGVPGSLIIESPPPDYATDWTAHLRSEYASDFGDQNRAGINLLFEHRSRFGIDTSADYRYQDLSVGHDDLWTGDFNIVYRFAQSEHIQMRSGLGFNWLADEIDTDLGFNFTYGADFFPAKPWVISTVIDWGRLGNASLFHGRATVGLVFDRFEVYTGYDYFDVGGTQLDGFIVGAGVWLN